ncbi:hypothetical protein MRBBS_0376 [Marinobacter sp. BSs20148]|nr:hypothetical protein MRBBS_0376 [Marinobacter sp. BSs20148]
MYRITILGLVFWQKRLKIKLIIVLQLANIHGPLFIGPLKRHSMPLIRCKMIRPIKAILKYA